MKRWRLWLGILISAAFLYLALRGQKLDQVMVALGNAEYIWLIPGVLAYFLGVVARTWRWHYLLRPLQAIPVARLFPLVTIGYMGNNIYPARAGEVLRSYVLRRRHGVSMSASLATVVVERIFDGLTMLFFVFIALPLFPLNASLRQIVSIFTVLFLAALAVFLYLAAAPVRAAAIYGWLIARFVPGRFRVRVRELLDKFMTGLHALRSPRDVALLFGTSVVVWLLETLKYWFVMHAFPFEVNFFTLMLMNGVVNLFTTLPAAPGYVGTFDLPGIQVLESAGVAGEIATAYTLVLHAALWLPITLLGIWYMWRAHLSWQGVQADLAAQPPPESNSVAAPPPADDRDVARPVLHSRSKG